VCVFDQSDTASRRSLLCFRGTRKYCDAITTLVLQLLCRLNPCNSDLYKTTQGRCTCDCVSDRYINHNTVRFFIDKRLSPLLLKATIGTQVITLKFQLHKRASYREWHYGHLNKNVETPAKQVYSTDALQTLNETNIRWVTLQWPESAQVALYHLNQHLHLESLQFLHKDLLLS
jgi:hypothetical protein